MLNRHLVFILLLAAALVGPAVYFNGGWPELWRVQNAGYSAGSVTSVPVQAASHVNLSPSALAAPVAIVPVATPNYLNDYNPARTAGFVSPPPTPVAQTVILPGDANGPNLNAVPLEFMPVSSPGEVFRFDVNPGWVKQRWDRASVTNGGAGLSGLRVPLVTGVNASDLFGSLTYYFDAAKTVQKITFRGWSGNPSGLVNFVTQNHGFKNQPTSAAGLYIAKDRKMSTGLLFMQHPNVIRADNPTQQVAIMLEINNPNGPYSLSTEVASVVFNNRR